MSYIAYLAIGIIVLRVLLAYVAFAKIVNGDWGKAAVTLAVGFGTNFANVYLARYQGLVTDETWWAWDAIATAVFQGAVVFALYVTKEKLFPWWYLMTIVGVAISTFLVQNVTAGTTGIVLRAILLGNSLLAMILASFTVAWRVRKKDGVFAALILGLILIYPAVCWDLVINNIRG